MTLNIQLIFMIIIIFDTFKMTDKNSIFEDIGNILLKKIIVIGAGISGLASAKRLKELGFQNVVILEAKDRIGGRVFGNKIGSTTLQMGAQWIHGQVNNAIYEMADAKNLIDKGAFDYSKAVRNLGICSKEEKEILIKLFEYIEKKNSEIPKNNPAGTSYLQYLEENFQAYVTENKNLSYEILQSGFDWYCRTLLEVDSCLSLSLLSLNLYGNYEECEGIHGIEVKGGLSSILDIFIPHADSLFTNKHVVKIDWSDFKTESSSMNTQKQVRITCEDESVFIADHVIITIPLGYLKKHHHTLFVPQLSKPKQTAIQSLGFGTINKIYFKFEEPFWKAPDMFHVFRHHNKELKGWTGYISRFSYTPGVPDVLCAWIAGEGAILVESVPTNEVTKSCINVLQNILKKPLPMPSDVIRTAWHSDPFTCGSYSFLSIDCELNGVSHSTLVGPEYAYDQYPVLMLAGEATHSSHFATVHGAYETGIHEAERLFKFYSQ